jgi:flagellar protein FliS
MNGISAYQDTSVSTQNNGRLIVMLYDGAIKFLRLAVDSIKTEDFEAKSKYINKAIDIINELNTVLDMEAGGDIASNLRQLYSFMTRHISQASINKDPQAIQEVITLLEELNQGWKAIC